MIFYVLVIYYFLMSIADYMRSKGPISLMYGIRSQYTMRTDDHWEHAHKTSSKINFIIGSLVFLLTIIASIFIDLYQYTFIVIILQLIPIIFARTLAKKSSIEFDQAYKRSLEEEGEYELLEALYNKDSKE